MNDLAIRPLTVEDRPWVGHFLQSHWGSAWMVTRGRVHQADQLPGRAAWLGAQLAGLITLHIAGDECEIVTLDSLVEGRGIGTALIEAAKTIAIQSGCRRLWLITTNDNLAALRFYQRRGFHLAALYPRAIEISRRLKPQIPLTGLDGIPLRDEIELEMILA